MKTELTPKAVKSYLNEIKLYKIKGDGGMSHPSPF